MPIHNNTKTSTTTGFVPVMNVLGMYWLVFACIWRVCSWKYQPIQIWPLKFIPICANTPWEDWNVSQYRWLYWPVASTYCCQVGIATIRLGLIWIDLYWFCIEHRVHFITCFLIHCNTNNTYQSLSIHAIHQQYKLIYSIPTIHIIQTILTNPNDTHNTYTPSNTYQSEQIHTNTNNTYTPNNTDNTHESKQYEQYRRYNQSKQYTRIQTIHAIHNNTTKYQYIPNTWKYTRYIPIHTNTQYIPNPNNGAANTNILYWFVFES